MDDLSHPLEILSRAVHHKNLTAASQHIGLSQPQLSRLVKLLEDNLDLVLLDRSAKRKAAWTPQALTLAEIYVNSSRRLQEAIKGLQVDYEPHSLHLGCLEGLLEMACGYADKWLKSPKLKQVQLDVFDLSELEDKFLAGELDFILSIRTPAKAKPRFTVELGYQVMESFDKNINLDVLSLFEFTSLRRSKKQQNRQAFISNSLLARRYWLETYGGRGMLPSPILRQRPKEDAIQVILIGSESLSPALWERLTQ